MVQIPFCQNCGYCKCKVCNTFGEEFFVEAIYRHDTDIIEIEVNEILTDQNGGIALSFEETLQQRID